MRNEFALSVLGRFAAFAFSLVAVFGVSSSASAVPMFQGLGDLPGESFSNALSVSADGSTVVGASGNEAFLWTIGSGMVGLGVLPGGTSSQAWAASADGSTVVGTGHVPSGAEAFIWTSGGGMVGSRRSVRGGLLQ